MPDFGRCVTHHICDCRADKMQSLEAVAETVIALAEDPRFDEEDRRLALTADSELVGACRAALDAEGGR